MVVMSVETSVSIRFRMPFAAAVSPSIVALTATNAP